VFGHRGGAAAPVAGGARDVSDAVRDARRAGAPALRQWAGVYGNGDAQWLAAVDVETLFIEPGSPWENGYVESFNGKLRDELLDREIFYTLTEPKIVIERWRREYNTIRPHSALGYRPPAPAAISPAPLSGLIMNPALS
jgi:transposase InsO family protein